MDILFAMHPNMREHFGDGLSIGKNIITGSTKQKLNTTNSTKTEIVGTNNFIPVICWMQYFLNTQNYNLKNNILFQDNKRSIFFKKNGKSLSNNCTKYINIFFVADRIFKE